ncbi:hypothetical protein [Flavonifractor plautii]|jgi:hypothetical protein|uniref:hypothetical protein n=1 Tax=Flavonifractor plautii TaxID=292800 RepID=UPI00321A6857
MERAIDGELLELEIANIANKLAKSDAQKALMGRVMYCVEHMPTLTPPNEPLTWNELGNMVEKPVYIVELEDGESCWVLVHAIDDIKALFVSAFDQYDYRNRGLYGQTWLAYRRPPEGEANA